MLKKAIRSSTPGVRPSLQKTTSIPRQGEVKQKKKKKGVTWADQIPQPSKEFPPQEALTAMLTHDTITYLVPVKEDATVGLEDYTNLEGLSETVESGCMETPQPASTANGTEEYISAPIVNENASTLASF